VMTPWRTPASSFAGMSRTKRYWEELRWFERDERH
jgi:hypothetical protein